MRIALDLSGVDAQTGVRVYAVQLLEELQRINLEHQFYVIMRECESHIYPVDGRLFKPLFMPARAESTIGNIAWHWSGLPRLLRKTGIDIIHQLDCNRVFPSLKCPLVLTVHGLIDPAVPGRRHFLRQHYNATIIPRLLNLASRIISVSNNTKKDLLRYTTVPSDKISVIHEGCALQGTEHINRGSARDLLLKHYGIGGDFILYVARLEHPNKNHISLLQAYDQLLRQGVWLPRLVFVGGNSYRSDVVRRTVVDLSLSDRVTITGFVPNEHLPAFYRCAHLYACPTLYEGFGLPLLEAMQFGIPIVCSNTSSLPELVGTAAITFNPNDVTAISSALNAALSDEVLRERLRQAGYEQLKSFNATEMAKKTLEIYESLKPPSLKSAGQLSRWNSDPIVAGQD